MKILQISAHYYPNLGGVETHLLDLVEALIKRGHSIFVLTYRPLTTKNVKWKIFEQHRKKVILRIPYLPGLFYDLVTSPILEFLYLFPGLFFVLPFVIIFYGPDVIHSHGLIAGTIAAFWGKMLGKRVVISTHSIYNFPEKGVYRNFVKLILSNVSSVICLSRQSVNEVKTLGVPKEKVGLFTYWIDLKKFKKNKQAKKVLRWNEKFIVFFVGRLIVEKGIVQLLEAAQIWNKNITLIVAGSGPLESYIVGKKTEQYNLVFLGKIDYDHLPLYYSAADLLVVPSMNEEGFGRVILESLACGTPVVGSNKGAIPEAMNSNVGKLIDVSPANIARTIDFFFKNRKLLVKMGINARKFAESNYSERNVDKIINNYIRE